MYALAINGSPRKGGNTETLLKHVLEPLEASGWETELIPVGGKKSGAAPHAANAGTAKI